MADSFHLDVGQRIESHARVWYRIVQRLGTGGNATTFLAVSTNGPYHGIPFAIKVFKNVSRPERVQSFLKEIDFLRACSHPSVMRTYDEGEIYGKYPFVVAEYLPETLRTVMRGKSPPTDIEKISYSLQLLSAINYLSSFTPPVIHRDIKPDNILIKGRSCVLCDFGLMKHVVDTDEDREILKESAGAGMPFRYRTPDQVAYLKGEAEITPKSDVFQLGLVLTELFTGRNPAKEAKRFTDPVELESMADVFVSLSAAISDLIGRMLTLDVSTRATASELLGLWDGIFQSAVEDAHAQNKRVF